MDRNSESSASTWVKIYCYITLAAALYGIAWAHVPFLCGHPWSTCACCPSRFGCDLTFHLVGAPVALFNIYVAWYGLKRFTWPRRNLFAWLLVFSCQFNFVFFLFEVNTLSSTIQRLAPLWESIALGSIAVMMLGGCILAMYVHRQLIGD